MHQGQWNFWGRRLHSNQQHLFACYYQAYVFIRRCCFRSHCYQHHFTGGASHARYVRSGGFHVKKACIPHPTTWWYLSVRIVNQNLESRWCSLGVDSNHLFSEVSFGLQVLSLPACVCLSVCPCVRQSQACPRDKYDQILTRGAKQLSAFENVNECL